MALDEGPGNGVARRDAKSAVHVEIFAVLVAGTVAVGCRPAVRPDAPEPAGPLPRTTGGPTSGHPGRQWLVGEMCPQGAGGRPAVVPLFLRSVGWTDEADAVSAPLARGSVGQLAVLAVDGRRAGVFSVMGVADVGLPQDVAVGSYAGASPCTTAHPDGSLVEDPACMRAVSGCGLAVAVIEPGQGAFTDGEAPVPQPGAACVAGDALAIDVDSDGVSESFSLAQLLDPVRAPAEEMVAAPAVISACTGRFTQLGIRLTPGIEPGGAVDPRYVVFLDVLGVIDIDGDGRREVFLAFRYPEGQGRTVAVYSAASSAGRLELVGEAVPWQR